MIARRFSAATLIGLTLGYTGPSTLRHVEQGTLRPTGPALRLKGGLTGHEWARRGNTLAIALRSAGIGPIEIVDTRTLRVQRSIRTHALDICGMTFDGPTLVAVTSDGACYFDAGRKLAIERIDIATRHVISITPISRSSRAIFPLNLAFGDGQAFVSQPGGVQAVDLRTGHVTYHVIQRRTFAKEDTVHARWLGGHLLGVGARIVDVRTWKSRVLWGAARDIAPAGKNLVASGVPGVALYSRSGRFVHWLMFHTSVATTWTVSGVTYALYFSAMIVVDDATGKRLAFPAFRTPMLLLAA